MNYRKLSTRIAKFCNEVNAPYENDSGRYYRQQRLARLRELNKKYKFSDKEIKHIKTILQLWKTDTTND